MVAGLVRGGEGAAPGVEFLETDARTMTLAGKSLKSI
jgi:hypothetical protein